MIVDDMRRGMILETKSPFMKYKYILIEDIFPETDINSNDIRARGSSDGEHWFHEELCRKHLVAKFYEFLQYEESRQPAPETSRLADVE